MARTEEVVIMPAFNEAARVADVVAELRRFLPLVDLVVIDDGSHDGTAAAAQGAGAQAIQHPFNLGYGAALQTGYRYALRAGYERCLQIDADGQHDAAVAPALLAAVRDGTDIAMAVRTGDASRSARGLGRRFLRLAGRWLVGREWSDPTSGYRALSRRALMALDTDMLPDDYPDLDVLIALSFAGMSFREYPVEARARRSGTSMHRGLRPIYYAYKVLLASVLATVRGRVASAR